MKQPLCFDERLTKVLKDAGIETLDELCELNKQQLCRLGLLKPQDMSWWYIEQELKKHRRSLAPGVFDELGTRAENCLWNEKILTVEDLCKKTRRELLDTPNFGRVSLAEVVRFLDARGLSLKDEEHDVELQQLRRDVDGLNQRIRKLEAKGGAAR